MDRQKTICHGRKCALDKMRAFLSAMEDGFDGYVMVSQVDRTIRVAYEKTFNEELVYTESSTCTLS